MLHARNFIERLNDNNDAITSTKEEARRVKRFIGIIENNDT
jgi:hypothetical protein